MSVVYQADVFCDSNRSSGCHLFVLQDKTYHNTTAGISRGAWEVAKAAGWEQRNEGGRRVHYCPACKAY